MAEDVQTQDKEEIADMCKNSKTHPAKGHTTWDLG